MDNGWSETTLGELCDRSEAKIQTGPFGSQLHSYDYQPQGVPVVPTEGIGRRRLREDDIPRVSGATAERLSRHKLQPGDILFARRGVQATGLSAIVESKHEGWLCGTGAILLRLETPEIDPLFPSFALSSDVSVAWLKSHAVGAVMPNLNEGVLRRLPLQLPPFSEQRAIATVLGALDDKIELNRRMNETLEALAQTLFKSWFVDPTATALPKSWRKGTLGEIAEVIDCLHSKKPERQSNGKPLLQLWNIRDDGLIDMEDTYFIADDDYLRWILRMEAKPGDCVITNVGRVAATAQVPQGLRAALGRNMTGVRCRQDFPFPTFLIECLLSSAMKEEVALKTDTGTILNSLNVRNIPKLGLVIPPFEVAAEFETIARPLRAKMELNFDESRNLAALRDALLPKLLSGELRISAAMKEMEPAV